MASQIEATEKPSSPSVLRAVDELCACAIRRPGPNCVVRKDCVAAVLESHGDLLEVLIDWLEAAEHDYGVPDENDGDDEPVALGEEGGSATTFGHLRRARAVIDRAVSQ